MAPVAPLAAEVRRRRAPAAPDNPFLAWERTWADITERSIDAWRDMRDAWFERSFHAVYGWLGTLGIASAEPPVEVPANLLAEAPEVRLALARMAEGGYAEAVVRMMILLAQARGGVRRDRLVRSSALLRETEPFASMSSGGAAGADPHPDGDLRHVAHRGAGDASSAAARRARTAEGRSPRWRAWPGRTSDMGDAARAMLRRIRTTLGVSSAGGGGPVPFHAAAIPLD